MPIDFARYLSNSAEATACILSHAGRLQGKPSLALPSFPFIHARCYFPIPSSDPHRTSSVEGELRLDPEKLPPSIPRTFAEFGKIFLPPSLPCTLFSHTSLEPPTIVHLGQYTMNKDREAERADNAAVSSSSKDLMQSKHVTRFCHQSNRSQCLGFLASDSF